jgi:hypothetical protein
MDQRRRCRFDEEYAKFQLFQSPTGTSHAFGQVRARTPRYRPAIRTAPISQGCAKNCAADTTWRDNSDEVSTGAFAVEEDNFVRRQLASSPSPITLVACRASFRLRAHSVAMSRTPSIRRNRYPAKPGPRFLIAANATITLRQGFVDD